MSSAFGFLSVVTGCGTVLTLAFMILLALPDSRMRQIVKHGLLALGCVVYVLWPLDLMPEAILGPLGILDDLGAALVGVNAARQAMRSARASNRSGRANPGTTGGQGISELN